MRHAFEAESSGQARAGELTFECCSGRRGLFGAIHGAGETLRGTINSTLDGLGDA